MQVVRWLRRDPSAGTRAGDEVAADIAFGELAWTSRSVVTVADRPTRFAFAVSGTEDPTAVWTYALTPRGAASTEVTYAVELGTGPSMFGRLPGGDPQVRRQLEQARLDLLADGMRVTLAALPSLSRP